MGALTLPARPLRRPCRVAGFTLIEILVVLTILGIAAALVTARLEHDPRRVVESEARRLAGALEAASALARWRGATLGVSAEGTTYRFWERGRDDRWQPVSQDERLRARTLPDDVVVRPLAYAGAPVAADAVLPLRPGGHNDPYAIELASAGWHARIESDALDRIAFTVAPAARP